MVRSALQNTHTGHCSKGKAAQRGPIKNIDIISPDNARLMSVKGIVHSSFPISPTFYKKAAAEYLVCWQPCKPTPLPVLKGRMEKS